MVLNISSVGGMVPDPGIGYYNATKAGIDRVVRKVIAERGGKVSHLNREVLSEVAGLGGVRVNWTNSVREHVVKEGKA